MLMGFSSLYGEGHSRARQSRPDSRSICASCAVDFSIPIAVARAAANAQHPRQRLPGIRFLRARHLLRRALRHDSPASRTAFGAEIDNPIRLFDDVQVV